jgi:prepilin peptidase CpaA
MNELGHILLHSVVLVIALISAYTDLRYRKILNLVTLPAMVLGLILQFSFFGFSGLLSALLGFLIGFRFLFFVLYFWRHGSGGCQTHGRSGHLVGQD